MPNTLDSKISVNELLYSVNLNTLCVHDYEYFYFQDRCSFKNKDLNISF